uniref:Uncharacterized protein n=1 Tax=Glossina palpalis gambiensis TaxID=67801 RepID=A0A1B0BW67_9MUSC
MSIFGSEGRAKAPVARLENSRLVGDIILGRLQGHLDTGANSSILKAGMPDFMPHVLDIAMAATKARMADGIIHVVDNVTLGLEGLEEVEARFAFAGNIIQFRRETQQLIYGKMDATTCPYLNSSQISDKTGTYGEKPQKVP